MSTQSETFARLWQIPQLAEIQAEWQENLAIMGDLCGCPDGYHRLWGGLRLARRNVGLYREAEQLRAILAPILGPAREIVLAGSADHLVLALLASIAGDNRGKHYHLIDRCPAPLAVAGAYAARQGLALTPHPQTLDTPLPPGIAPDLVFMHYTFNFMDTPTRTAVLARFAGRLAPGGRIVVSHRHSVREPAENEAAVWTEAVLAELPEGALVTPEMRAAFDTHLHAYARSRGGRFVEDIAGDALARAASAAGLAVISREETRRDPSDPGKTLRASGQPDGAIYVIGRD